MGTSTSCSKCGAGVPPNQHFCGYCGTETFPENTQHVFVHEVKQPEPTLEERFAALREAPTFDAMMAHKPSKIRIAWVGMTMIGTGAITVVFVSGFIAIASGMPGQGPPFPFLLIPIVMGLFGVGMVFAGLFTVAHATAEPVRPVPALVLGESTEHHRSGKHGMSTTHYLSLRVEDGTSQTYQATAQAAAAAREDAVGVAYLLGNKVLDFRPL